MAKPLNPLKFFDNAHTPEPNSGCWLWTRGVDITGYGVISTEVGAQKAHRFSWRLHKGEIPAGMLVLHKCDVPPCVNPDHLFLGTPRDNHDDMVAKGRRARTGGHNPKLTQAIAAAIRNRPNEKGSVLAAEYGISPALVSMVRHGHRWRGDR